MSTYYTGQNKKRKVFVICAEATVISRESYQQSMIKPEVVFHLVGSGGALKVELFSVEERRH